jgi:hypothetical protein
MALTVLRAVSTKGVHSERERKISQERLLSLSETGPWRFQQITSQFELTRKIIHNAQDGVCVLMWWVCTLHLSTYFRACLLRLLSCGPHVSLYYGIMVYWLGLTRASHPFM